mmetsp:Transcript_111536/g.193304  ORF Transcript_111536/g.193304 Transcript_111536/m.193304 type:complete len:260 (+) Transcript_111536:2363-3142(+)
MAWLVPNRCDSEDGQFLACTPLLKGVATAATAPALELLASSGFVSRSASASSEQLPLSSSSSEQLPLLSSSRGGCRATCTFSGSLVTQFLPCCTSRRSASSATSFLHPSDCQLAGSDQGSSSSLSSSDLSSMVDLKLDSESEVVSGRLTASATLGVGLSGLTLAGSASAISVITGASLSGSSGTPLALDVIMAFWIEISTLLCTHSASSSSSSPMVVAHSVSSMLLLFAEPQLSEPWWILLWARAACAKRAIRAVKSAS